MDRYDSDGNSIGDGDGDSNGDDDTPNVIVEVFTQSMSDLVGKRKSSAMNGLQGVEILIVDVTELFDELYSLWSTHGNNLHYCLDEEEKILGARRIDKPMDFEAEEHPLKDSSDAECVLDWLNTRLWLHIDDDEMYGVFEDDHRGARSARNGNRRDHGGTRSARSARNGNGRYTLKCANDHRGAISVWPKEIYAAVHAARDCGHPPRKLYEEYMKRSMSDLVDEGF